MIISTIAFIAVFTIIALVHELGHFMAARRAGVRVYEFSIGFPFSPKIITLFRHKETEFTLRLLPLGGFVSFSKDNNEDMKDLFDVSLLKRALIMSAGSLSNIIFAFLIFVPVLFIYKNLSFLEAVQYNAETLWEILSGTMIVILNIFSGSGSLEGLTGPVGIASMAGQAASKGLLNLMYFAGILSMSLGIMNLLPLPALDGGQLVALVIESFRKKPLSLRTYQVVSLIGIFLFVILTVFVTYKDIVRIIT